MWKEDEHPRDEDGKFTDKNGNSVSKPYYRQNASYGEILAQNKKVPRAYEFCRRDTKHHKKHAQEMGLNQRQYEEKAIDFINGNKGIFYFSNMRKRFYKYDEKSKLFAVTSDGKVHTFQIMSSKKFEKVKRQDLLNEI